MRSASWYCIVRQENPISPGRQSRTSASMSARVGTGGRFSFRLSSRVGCPARRRQAESEASPWLNPIWV
jgi:hypothetical protein